MRPPGREPWSFTPALPAMPKGGSSPTAAAYSTSPRWGRRWERRRQPPIVPSTASAGPAASAGATSAGGKLQGKADNVYPLQRDREKDKPPMSNRLPVMLLDRLLKRLIREGEIVTTWPDGSTTRYGSPTHDPAPVHRKSVGKGKGVVG